MQKLGLTINIKLNSYPELLRKKARSSMNMYNMDFAALYPDPQSFFQLLYGPNRSPGINGSNFQNAEYDSLYIKAANEPDNSKRLEIYKRMRDIINEECPMINLVHRLHFIMIHSSVKNYLISDFCHCREMYLDIER